MQVQPSKSQTFLCRSASVASLVAWNQKFSGYSSKLNKKPSFVTHTESSFSAKGDTKLMKENLSKGEYNAGPANDCPPAYKDAVKGYPSPPRPPEKKMSQDFTALETYLKKRLSIKKKSDSRLQDQQLESEKVFRWLNQLPDGDNLEEFLEAYGIPTKGVDVEDLKGKLRVFLNERLQQEAPPPEYASTIASEEAPATESARRTSSEERKEKLAKVPEWQRQLSSLEELAHGDNLENWLESLDVPYYKPIPETKNEIRKYLNIHLEGELKKSSSSPDISENVKEPELPSPNLEDIAAMAPKWKELVEKMRDLKDENELDKWLDSLDVPCNLPKAKVKADIKKFFMHENYENFAGKSLIYQDHSLAKELWEKFEDSSVLKQVAVVSGTTVALGLIAALSTTLLSFAFPPALAANPFFVEIFANYFLQRQEVAFNLLNFHAQNAKPLSTAWAKQYILWKYC